MLIEDNNILCELGFIIPMIITITTMVIALGCGVVIFFKNRRILMKIK